MRRLAIAALAGLCSVAAWAAYPSFVFVTSDGAEHQLASAGLEISFSDGKLLASAGGKQVELELSDIVSMRFSEAEPGQTALVEVSVGIDSVIVYSVSGAELGSYASVTEAVQSLNAGIYIVRDSNGNTSKITVAQ